MSLFNLFKKRPVFVEMTGPLVIIIMGPQGSGKGTQGELLKSHFGIPLITVGQMLRDEIKKDTALGQEIATYINHGSLVPPRIANEVVKTRIKESDEKKGYILDGYPRDMEQTNYFTTLVKPTMVILLDIPESETMRRLAGIRVCVDCKLNFNIATLDQGIKQCTKCGGNLEARVDDVPEAILKRLKIYGDETMPVVRFYEKMGVLEKVNGVGSPREVWKRILRVVPLVKKHP